MILVIRKKLLLYCAGLFLFLCGMAVALGQGSGDSVAAVGSAGQCPAVVVIDAGHGGEDGGAVSADGTVESTLNLQISRRLNDLLRLLGQNTEMTRRENISIHSGDADTLHERKVSDLKNRVALVNGLENSVLLSIHQNKLPSSPSVHGAQAFYNHVDGSADIAKSIQAALNRSINSNNAKSEKRIPSTIYLMKNITAPAVLVECGFLSNPAETDKLETGEYQIRLAVAIAAGYLNCNSAGEDVP